MYIVEYHWLRGDDSVRWYRANADAIAGSFASTIDAYIAIVTFLRCIPRIYPCIPRIYPSDVSQVIIMTGDVGIFTEFEPSGTAGFHLRIRETDVVEDAPAGPPFAPEYVPPLPSPSERTRVVQL